MKIHIGPYIEYLGPYQIVDKLFFWQEDYPDNKLSNRWDYKLSSDLSKWLASTWVDTACEWIQKHRHRKIKIKIHDYDAWSVDSTLAIITLPLMKKLRDTKHSYAIVELEDVPEHLRNTSTEDYDDQSTFGFYKKAVEPGWVATEARWKWVLDEIIWAFEQQQPDCDWEDQYWTIHPKLDLTEYSQDSGQLTTPVRWEVEGECDWEARQAHHDRIKNGLRLFGKYYQNLWD